MGCNPQFGSPLKEIKFLYEFVWFALSISIALLWPRLPLVLLVSGVLWKRKRHEQIADSHRGPNLILRTPNRTQQADKKERPRPQAALSAPLLLRPD